ncbi:MAG: phosphate ABC transporter permease [Acidobacteria bacterium]|nr:MAG: phosphate ABC transporter permease [Acidobacteriota bacterium]
MNTAWLALSKSSSTNVGWQTSRATTEVLRLTGHRSSKKCAFCRGRSSSLRLEETKLLSETTARITTSQIVIESGKADFGLGLAEAWRYRELLFFLAWRDIRLRYKQTALGATWAIIQPLFAMILFTIVFGRVARIPSDNIPYALFAYAGLVPWTFFSNAITNSANSLIGSTSLITKVYFPRMIIPLAPVLAGLLDLAIALLLLIPLIFYYGIIPSWHLLLLPLFILLTTVLAFGVGMFMAALNVKYRDVRYALPFLVQLWLFASPVIYPLSILRGKWKFLLALNPMTGIIEGFRSSLVPRPFDWGTIGVSVIVTFLIVFISIYEFQRVEDGFADVI